MNHRNLIKGISYGWNSYYGDLRSKEGLDSFQKMLNTTCNWVAITIPLIQDTFCSTKIYFDYARSVPDYEIIETVNYAHEKGLKVCLKPVVNPSDGVWRGFIYFSEAYDYWNRWFLSYRKAMEHYAELAKRSNCEMFCVGCEMVYTEKMYDDWVEVIDGIREKYYGSLIYNANHGYEKNPEWWEHLDFIGISAYKEMPKNAGELEMFNCWCIYKEELFKLHNMYKKPIIFMELGCMSGQGCSEKPWDYKLRGVPYNEDEQALYLHTALKCFWYEPWFGGCFIWDWPVKLNDENEVSKYVSYSIYGKKAEKVIKEWYSKNDFEK